MKNKQNTLVWNDFPDYFQIELQNVISIAFFIRGRINCDIIQMQLQIFTVCITILYSREMSRFRVPSRLKSDVWKYVISDAASVYAWKQASAVKTWIAFSRYNRPLGYQVYQTQLTFTHMPWREYGVGTKWEWVNNDIIFIVQFKLFI